MDNSLTGTMDYGMLQPGLDPNNPSYDQAIKKLDSLTWSFRISKIQERNSPAVWAILYVNPNDKTWYTSQADNLLTALKDTIANLELPKPTTPSLL